MKLAKIAFICIAGIFCATNMFSQSRPVATAISAKSGVDKTIEIQWAFPKKTEPQITGIKVYRAAKPISAYKEIEQLEPIANVSGSGTKYTDIAPTSGEYFYAVVATTARGDYKTIIPGMNTTTKGVHAKIPASQLKEKGYMAVPEVAEEEAEIAAAPESLTQEDEEAVETAHEVYKEENTEKGETITVRSKLPELTKKTRPPLRNIPLPLPSDLLGLKPERMKVSKSALKSVAGLTTPDGKKPEPKRTPYFFEDDMFAADGGDDYILFETLRAGLVQRKYEHSVELLSDFLSINRTVDATNRAEFYLGESLYFCGEYNKAIRCFLSVQEAFPELAKEWLDSSLDLLEIEF